MTRYARCLPRDPGLSAGHMMDGDVKDVHGILFGCAQIAWSLGWRPKGLLPKVMEVLTSFKPLPPGPQGR